jgi:hypothetical protein
MTSFFEVWCELLIVCTVLPCGLNGGLWIQGLHHVSKFGHPRSFPEQLCCPPTNYSIKQSHKVCFMILYCIQNHFKKFSRIHAPEEVLYLLRLHHSLYIVWIVLFLKTYYCYYTIGSLHMLCHKSKYFLIFIEC